MVAAAVLAGCGGGGTLPPPRTEPPAGRIALSETAALGERMFFDPSLSASGRLACATCHDPANAHAPSNDRAVQSGGAAGDAPGLRAAPSLRYLGFVPAFGFGGDGRARGGYDADGRARSLGEQAQDPLLAAHEMALLTRPAAVARVRQAAYASEFLNVYGAGAFDDAEAAFAGLLHALEQYQLQAPEFRRFDSRFDAYLAGQTALSAAEQRGLALFEDPRKGNCAACHPSTRDGTGVAPLFTNFGYANLGVPRNRAIAANADPAFFDLGLCGPLRSDLAARHDLCGAFRTPTLRNVATRHVFFHNGVIRGLRDAVAFHVRRDTHPHEWYPLGADGSTEKFDDLPAAYRGNVERSRAPFDRRLGMAPALDDGEIDDLVQFLGTLTDGYRF